MSMSRDEQESCIIRYEPDDDDDDDNNNIPEDPVFTIIEALGHLCHLLQAVSTPVSIVAFSSVFLNYP